MSSQPPQESAEHFEIESHNDDAQQPSTSFASLIGSALQFSYENDDNTALNVRSYSSKCENVSSY